MAMLPGAPASALNLSGANSDTGCQGVNMADEGYHTFYYDGISNQVTNAAIPLATRTSRIVKSRPTSSLRQTERTDVVARDSYFSGSILRVPVVGHRWNL